jgi:hypothetical protein
MNLQQRILRLGLAALLLVGLGACTVVPTYPVGYQHRPAYVETYPAYGYPGTSIYYQSGPRYFDSYGDRHYHGGRTTTTASAVPCRCHHRCSCTATSGAAWGCRDRRAFADQRSDPPQAAATGCG